LIVAHAEGQLDSFEDLNVEEVGVMAEWSTVGDDRVCELCEDLEGAIMTIDEARGLIPRHPNCRCAWIPANVGERSKAALKKARYKTQDKIDESIKSELPKKTRAGVRIPQTVGEAVRRSRWAGKDSASKAAIKYRGPIKTIDDISAALLEDFTKYTLKEQIETIRDLVPGGWNITEEQANKLIMEISKGAEKFKPVLPPQMIKVERVERMDQFDKTVSKLGVGKTSLVKYTEFNAKALDDILDVAEENLKLTLKRKKLPKKIKAGEFIDEIIFYGDRSLLDNGGISGVYHPITRNISFAKPGRSATLRTEKLMKGSQVVDESFAGAVRHEAGHAVHFSLESEAKREWKNLFIMDGNTISDYAGANQFESFAESYCSYTSKLYEKGFLNKKIEQFMDKYIGAAL